VSKSKFGALGAALKEKRDVGPGSEKQKKVTKSKNPDYAQTTVYLHRKGIHTPLQSALADERLEYSQLVEDLLREWLRTRKRPDV
jgi:hypothetical protein